MEKNEQQIFSVFSGTYYTCKSSDVDLLDEGQLPLTKKPNLNCKKCFGRGYTGRDTSHLGYVVCMCVRKVIDSQKIIKNNDIKI